MAFKVDVRPGEAPVRWETDGDGVVATRDEGYRPAIYAAAREDRPRYLEWLAGELAPDPKVAAVEECRLFRDLGARERSPFLRISLERLEEVRQVAREVRQRERADHAPGVVSLYDVDLDPQFRYCLDTGHDPVPGRELRRLSLSIPRAALAAGDLTELTVAGEAAGDSVAAVRRRVERALAERDPDVLVLSSADLVPLLADAGVDLGRRPGHRKLAGESTYVSYGRVGHSPARYDVPGRVLVDRSNSFLLGHSSMAGLDYFVREAGKPLQEVAHDSIGGVLTALEIRAARERDVPAPWQKRQTERWKTLEELHAADRGGFSFQPEPGVHEDVHELDFASLYPEIIRTRNVSPETVCCDCHDRADVPELGYSVCDREGFLGEVLSDLLDDRQGWKAALEGAPPDERAALEAKIEAVKWVLVSCFGYQGYRHAKFGRIETHEAINAFARDIMLTAKDIVEDAGWRIVHGIVDSLWVTADPGRTQTPIREVAAAVSDAVGIELEYEGRFDWIAFCPRKRASGSALMRYFGRWADGGEDPYKFRGIETRQHSTSEFVATAQRDLVAAFDDERAPEPVCDRLARHLATLRRGAVPASDLVVEQRVSQRADEYQSASRARAALERAASLGVERHPGQTVRYVVVDDDRSGPGRVRLAFEDADDYDADFYADRLVRACESVVGPLGWDEGRIRRFLAGTRDARLSSFGRDDG
ncbi:MAG: type B DNA-directed DNA polymerase [Halorientalis sp.]